MRLTPRMALSMALAVNELATNATKYGSLSAQSGRVEVSWRIGAEADGAEPELSWTWHESGGPPVVPPQRRGFGSVLIERVLGADFGGVVTMQYAPSGVIAELRVPVSNLPLPGGNEANGA
jgi:two-component sensor histidine kinase